MVLEQAVSEPLAGRTHRDLRKPPDLNAAALREALHSLAQRPPSVTGEQHLERIGVHGGADPQSI